MSASYLRCSHCRGFYELALSHCRYCGKDVPMKGGDGAEQVFVDREMCRAIQVAEYEQRPPEAHADCMRPDPQLLDKLCGCLHCGPEGGLFEAVEMRWIVNERMWACPCTTCGGRGFTFDIHVVEPLWQCECGHWYSPPENDRRHSQAKCPNCGSNEASGWFDDEQGEEEWDDGEGAIGTEEEGWTDDEKDGATAKEEDVLPWEENDEEDADVAYLPEPPEREALRDDIDFPHEKAEFHGDEGGPPLKDEDIPF